MKVMRINSRKLLAAAYLKKAFSISLAFIFRSIRTSGSFRKIRSVDFNRVPLGDVENGSWKKKIADFLCKNGNKDSFCEPRDENPKIGLYIAISK